MIIDLAKSVSLLLSLCLIQGIIIHKFRHNKIAHELISGVLFGAVCIIGMNTPVVVSPGVIFDPRSVILSLAGLLGGPVTGVVAGLISGVYRAYLGGGGAPVGVSVVIACVGIGLVFRYAHQRGWIQLNLLTLTIFGAVVHAVEIGLFTQLPPAVVDQVLNNVALPLFVVFTPATALLGFLMKAIDDFILTQRKLMESESLLGSVFDNLPVGILIKNKDHVVEQVNRTYLEWYGLTRDQVIGRRSEDLGRFLTEEAAADMVRQEDAALKDGTTEIRTLERVFADGEMHTITVTKFPVLNPFGDIIKVGSISSDISELEDSKLAMHRAMKDAETASRAKSEFLAAMSHEFRTPLNAILGFSEILAKQYFGPPGEGKYREYANDIHASGEHLLELVNDLLDISMIEAGKRALNREAISIEDIVNDSLNVVSLKAEEKGLALHKDVGPGLPPLNADRRAVRQILLNLLSNAVKYTPAGGSIRVLAKADGSKFSLSVTDTGIGIPADKIERITEPFTRGDHEAYKTVDGWGLGLAIAQSLVDLHGGTLEIQSTVGMGSTVTVSLPQNVS